MLTLSAMCSGIWQDRGGHAPGAAHRVLKLTMVAHCMMALMLTKAVLGAQHRML